MIIRNTMQASGKGQTAAMSLLFRIHLQNKPAKHEKIDFADSKFEV
jgi:hypothetical protein